MARDAVEELLRLDPADAFGIMDAGSQESYRAVLAEVAAKSGAEQRAVAEACLELARAGALAKGASAPEAHVGFYLAGEGIGALWRAVVKNNALCRAVVENNALRRAVPGKNAPGCALRLRGASPLSRLLLYLLTVLLPAVAFTAGTALPVRAGGVRGGFFPAAVLLLAFASWQIAEALVNLLLVRRLAPPARMPRLDFSGGIPPQCRTLVVIPALLTDADAVETLLRGVECQFLNNRGANIHFALLTGFAGAASATLPEDARLLNPARLGILGLNRKYRGDGDGDFFLFHRPRVRHEAEKHWGAHNGRRGALEDLDRYLAGDDPEAFSRVEGPTHRLAGVRYVITLDAGTLLPRGAAADMAGAMAHPLNRPKYDPWRGRVVAGHGALRPRVRATLSGANRSLYALLSAGEPGVVDPEQASPEADTEQDLFGESPFPFDCGAGGGACIYDVSVAHRALGGRLADSGVAAHPLPAGSVLRAGLLNDVTVYADPPAAYSTDSARRLRNARGEWRLALCLFRRDGKALGAFGKYWIADRLRRCLLPLATVLLFASAAVSGNGIAAAAFSAVAGCLFVSCQRWFRSGGVLRQLGRAVFALACLPREACAAAGIGGAGMWICPVVATVFAAAAGIFTPSFPLYGAPVFLLWLLAQFLAERLSRARRERRETASPENIRFLRHVARRSWLFFEDSAEGVPARAATRDEAGLSLLACLSALDFGYATPGDTLRRGEKLLDALRAAEGAGGHAAGSSGSGSASAAESGDLAARVLVFAQGLREMTGAPVVPAGVWGGLLDAVQLAQAEAENIAPRVLSGCFDLERAVARLRDAPPSPPAAVHAQLAALEKKATALEAAWSAAAPRGAESGRWLRLFIAQCQAALGELGSLVPWAAEAAANPDWAAFTELAALPSLLDLVNMAPRMEAAETGDAVAVPPRLFDLVQQASVRAGHRLAVIQKLLVQCEALADVDLSPLAEEHSDSDARDGGGASDVLVAVYLGVARGGVPASRWFARTRGIGKAKAPSLSPAPFLVLPVFAGSRLDAACRAFGVPDPGLARAAAGEVVIEPHITALAAMFRPDQAARTLRLMASCGFLGTHGFYESVEYTPRDGRCGIVRSFSAARQGATLVALGQALLGRPMHRRFLANPLLNAASVLLQEPLIPRRERRILPVGAFQGRGFAWTSGRRSCAGG